MTEPASNPLRTRKSGVFPLKGETRFAKLMRIKPQAAWDMCLLHGQIIDIAYPSLDQQAFAKLALGLIVPKKVYPLAVDRNRVRRVLRAQCQVLVRELPYSIEVLFRMRSAKKGERKVPAPNPHSAAFAASVQHGLGRLLKTVATQSSCA